MTRNEYVAVAVATMSAARGAIAPLWYFCLPGSWDLKPSASLSMTSGVLSPPLGRRLPKKSRNDCRRPTGQRSCLASQRLDEDLHATTQCFLLGFGGDGLRRLREGLRSCLLVIPSPPMFHMLNGSAIWAR